MKSVLFYSFKGGVGRTQTMLNIAKYLSKTKNKKVAIVDFDIYAPGISYLANFGSDKEDKNYLLEYLLKLVDGIPTKLYYEEHEKNLYLIPSAQPSNLPRYHNLLTNFSKYLYSLKISAEERITNQFTAADAIFDYIMKSISDLNLNLDYVFFDCRTGITEVSDILFSNEVDLKVFISSFNNQNINGTNEILRMLEKQSNFKHSILRILSPQPINSHDDEFKDINSRANLDHDITLKDKFNWYGTYKISYDKRIVSNDVDAWDKFTDECLYKKEIISVANNILSICPVNNEIEELIKKIENEK
ncbi:AAA family ATPase [Aliarcobacter butzleri]|uniref:ParA family protein n=1 Tax=Aliarcobacter butzleri TaxID=28197 RepID=UPI001EDA4425|nr:AAA family ATPase [Aliarcobacter butzleri]MCG3701633.1 AAA family ATPase [Aliarcobacter butzleri]